MKRYIGRINLSKEDSEEWSSNPPFMYVVDKGDRAMYDNAILFKAKDTCIQFLKNDFKKYRHLSSSKMEVITLNIEVKSIERI